MSDSEHSQIDPQLQPASSAGVADQFDVPGESVPGDHVEGGMAGRMNMEMGFFEHLDELRSKIIKSLIAMLLTSIVCGVFNEFLMEQILMGPANRMKPPIVMQNLEPMGQVTILFQVVLISGLILAIPFVLWQLWQFIKPGLYPNERKLGVWLAVATIGCFLAGVMFAYFLMIPASLNFMMDFQFKGIENHFSISAYFSLILGFILAVGAVFEMPMLSYALSRFGILKPKFLSGYRRHAIVVILIIAAAVTPTPDPINQMMMAVPLYGLFEISILVSKVASRQRALHSAERA